MAKVVARPRADPVLLVALGLVSGGLARVAPQEVALGAAAILVLALAVGAAGARVALAAVLAIAIGSLRAGAAVARFEGQRAKADAVMSAPATCSAHVRVDSSPVRLRGALRWDAWVDRATCDVSAPLAPLAPSAAVAWAGRATIYGGPDDLARGDEADVVASLAPPQRLWNASSGDPRPGQARRSVLRSGGALDVRVTRRARGPLAWIDRLRARVRGRIEASFTADLAPMVRALVLGESDLAPDDDQAFRGSGLSHLLAVSGMHLVLVLTLGVRALEGILSRVEGVAGRVDVGRAAALVGIPVAWVYSDFAGAGGSTVRAAWMMTAALVARAVGRRTDAPRAFGLSLAIMAVLDALIAFDLSFALSAAATGGLLAFARPLTGWLEDRVPKLVAPAAGAVATTLAASVPCVPIVARFSPALPIGGVVANLLAVPLGECAALPLCLAQTLLWWWPAAERGCAAVASGALLLVRGIARGFSVPALTADVVTPTSFQLATLAVLLAAVVLRARPRAAASIACAAVVVLEVGARRAGAPRGVLRATFFDVGQGDAALVDLPTGDAILIDGGGLVGSPIDVGTRVIAPELRSRRRRDLAAVVLTHPHPDHFGGLATGLGAVRTAALWDTGQGERERVGGGYAALVEGARQRGVPILHPADLCGAHVLGGAIVEVLAPCPDFSPDRGPNDNSLVLRIAFGARAILFAGDAEREEESLLLATSPARLRADVLKVGHHGSRTSSSASFLAAVAPTEAVVSAGCRNRFGHPRPATLASLAAAGARVWRTDRDGAVTVTTDGRSLDVRAIAGDQAPLGSRAETR
jgi:competence protein ComEC